MMQTSIIDEVKPKFQQTLEAWNIDPDKWREARTAPMDFADYLLAQEVEGIALHAASWGELPVLENLARLDSEAILNIASARWNLEPLLEEVNV